MIHLPPISKPILGSQFDYSHPLAKGLVGWWLFNEGAGNIVQDLSGRGNHGTLVGGTNWVGGRKGHALNFDGVNDSVAVTPSSISAQTISYWAKPDANSYVADLNDVSYLISGGRFSGYVTPTSYINGAVSTDTLGSELASGNLGAEVGNTTYWDKYFGGTSSGSIAVNSTYKYAGSYSIATTVTNGGTINTDAQTFHYNNISGGTVSVTSGNLYRMQFAVMASAPLTGINAVLRISGSPYTNLSPLYTVDVENGTWRLYTMYFYATATSTDADLFFYFGGKGTFTIYFDAISVKQVTATSPAITNGTWQHVVHVLSSPITTTKLDIGGNVQGKFFDGLIDDFRIYNRALSAHEIKQLYVSG